jgi:hypothetical protein
MAACIQRAAIRIEREGRLVLAYLTTATRPNVEGMKMKDEDRNGPGF